MSRPMRVSQRVPRSTCVWLALLPACHGGVLVDALDLGCDQPMCAESQREPDTIVDGGSAARVDAGSAWPDAGAARVDVGSAWFDAGAARADAGTARDGATLPEAASASAMRDGSAAGQGVSTAPPSGVPWPPPGWPPGQSPPSGLDAAAPDAGQDAAPGADAAVASDAATGDAAATRPAPPSLADSGPDLVTRTEVERCLAELADAGGGDGVRARGDAGRLGPVDFAIWGYSAGSGNGSADFGRFTNSSYGQRGTPAAIARTGLRVSPATWPAQEGTFYLAGESFLALDISTDDPPQGVECSEPSAGYFVYTRLSWPIEGAYRVACADAGFDVSGCFHYQ
jgi:hypothetical protein